MVTGHGPDQPIKLWSTRSWEVLGTLASDGMRINSLQFSPDGSRLAACGGREGVEDSPIQRNWGWIRIWETGGDEVSQWSMTEVARRTDAFTKLNWTPDGNRLATASLKGHVQLWDASSKHFGEVGAELMRLPSQPHWQTPLNLSPDGTKLVLASGNSLVIHDASLGYGKVKSPFLLSGLESHIQSGTATPEDLLLRAQIYAAQGDWIKAEQACQDCLRRDVDVPWVASETWITGGFQGDLQAENHIETIAQAEGYSPANAIDEVTGNSLWEAIQVKYGEPIDILRIGQQQGGSRFAYAYQRIYSLVPQHAAIFLGNDDFHKLWVNGELLHEDRAAGSFEYEEWVVPVKLKPGWNSFLAKVASTGARGLGYSLRLSNDRDEMIEAYKKTDQLAQIVNLYDRELQAHPEETSLLLKRAEARWRLGDRIGANRDFAMVRTGREQDASVLQDRAEVYLSLDRFSDALADLDAAVALEPENIELLLKCVQVNLQYDRPRQMVANLQSLIELEPSVPAHHFYLCTALLESGRARDYEVHRSEMLTRWQNESDSIIANWLVVLSLLRPIEEQHLEIVEKLLETAVGSEPAKPIKPFLFAQELVNYHKGLQAASRQENSTAQKCFSQAQTALETEIETLEDSNEQDRQVEMILYARYALVLVLHHLQDERANQLLTQCEIDYHKVLQQDPRMGNIYLVRALRSEAIRTIVVPDIGLINEVEELLAAGEIKTAIERVRVISERQLASGVIRMRLLTLIEEHRLGIQVLTDTSEKAPMLWEYRFDKPDSDWTTTTGGLDWLTGPAPFGSSRSQNTDLQYGEPELWLRRQFQLSEIPQTPVKLRLSVQGSARVLLNGVELIHVQDWHDSGETHAYLEIDCTNASATALRTGANVLAVHYNNPEGSSLVDAGLHVVKDDLWGEILDKSIEQSPNDLQLVETRAKRHVREERYLEAADDYARFATNSPYTGIPALNTASLFALSGDRQAYQSYCQSQIELLDNDEVKDEVNDRYGSREHFVKSCLVLPGVISNDDLPLAVVESSMKHLAPNDRLFGYRIGTLALAAIRGGEFDKARERLALVERQIDSMEPSASGLIHALRARVLYEEGRELNQEQIDAALQRSMQAIGEQKVLRHPDGTLVGSSLFYGAGNLKHNAIIDELLRREVEQKMTELRSR